jgi:hypothetical protein
MSQIEHNDDLESLPVGEAPEDQDAVEAVAGFFDEDVFAGEAIVTPIPVVPDPKIVLVAKNVLVAAREAAARHAGETEAWKLKLLAQIFRDTASALEREANGG